MHGALHQAFKRGAGNSNTAVVRVQRTQVHDRPHLILGDARSRQDGSLHKLQHSAASFSPVATRSRKLLSPTFMSCCSQGIIHTIPTLLCKHTSVCLLRFAFRTSPSNIEDFSSLRVLDHPLHIYSSTPSIVPWRPVDICDRCFETWAGLSMKCPW